MTTIAATEVKNKLGQVLDRARKEPLMVQSHGRNVAVILGCEEYERLQRLEDAYWAARADAAYRSGILSPEETMASLTDRLRQLSDGE